MRILVVEDETMLLQAIAKGLRREGMAIDVASDGAAALEKLATTTFDVVVLDRDLPVLHGDDVGQALKMQSTSPRILMLTAMNEVEDRVQGLVLGADDYLGKPFAFIELVARIRALGRRDVTQSKKVLERHDLRLDTQRRICTRGEEPLRLTNKEFGVLEMLLLANGVVVSAEKLLEGVWDETTDPFSNTVRTTVTSLRRKLGDPGLIRTLIGVGYCIP
jgi:DNA-binding response OmpR family regulator